MKKRALTIVAACATALATAAAAAAAVVSVHPGHMDGWNVNNDTCGASKTSTVAFVNGPAAPPAGVGSVEFRVGANGDSYPTLRSAVYNGVRLSSLTALTYSTYVSQAPGSQAAYLDLYVDFNNDGVRDDIITFEPVYNGTVQKNAWQHWNALGGQWWSDALGGPPPLFTLASYEADHPNASILGHSGGNLILAAGCGGAAWTGFVGNADALTVGVNGNNTTYDFEPAIGPPTSKDQCKNGGWSRFNNPPFKNQGQCVAYANHHDGKGNDDQKHG